jgi:uncharacterized SAM-binding protein YcdF (DUF218 family)
MFYFLSKSIDFLLMPFCISFFLLIYALVVKSRKRSRRALTFALIMLFLISNTYLVNKAFLWWEPGVVKTEDLQTNYGVGVVLSGGLINTAKVNDDVQELGSHVNRLFGAYQLYQAGKIRKILITGTSSAGLLAMGKGEVRQAGQVLQGWGVPPDDIVLEERARNTRENALFSAEILKKQFANEKFLLITSGYHMPRSLGCFRKAGVSVDHFVTDFYGVRGLDDIKRLIIPDVNAIGNFDLLWHEWIGYVTYRIMGYC